MKHTQNNLKKILSLVASFGISASTFFGAGFFMPQVAEATGDQQSDKGEIWVCKTLLDSEGNLTLGSDNDQEYTVEFTGGPQDLTHTFDGVLEYNTELFGDFPGDSAECEKFENLEVGDYYYIEEVIKNNSELYETPLYHDGYQGQATNISQLIPFDGQNDIVDGHIVLKKDEVRVLVVLNQLKEVQSVQSDSATLYASKVVCDDESDLPDWGAGIPDDITATTAQEWVNDSNGKCEIVAWDFQWAQSSTSNPGDNLGNQGDWTTFSGSTTIPESEFGNDKYVWVREVFDEDYVPFTGVNTDQNVSAEVYCATDGLHYNNYDRVDDLEVGEEYHCVGFNALKDAPAAPTSEDPDDEENENTPTRRGSSGGFLRGASISVDDDDSSDEPDDDSNGEVMGASTSYPGLPNAGVAPAVELVRTASSGVVGFTLYSMTSRRTLALRKKAR
ncbi:MAG: hypothetical protein WDZ75_00505 [Candidatus Paceibacterota bacterium]